MSFRLSLLRHSAPKRGALAVTALALATLALFGCPSDDAKNSTRAHAEHTPGALLEAGEELELQDSLVEALRCYDSCVALLGRPGGDTTLVLPCLVARARLHLVLDLYGRAQSDAELVLKLQQDAVTPAERGQVWLILAGSLQGENLLPQADTASDSALSLIALGPSPDSALHIDALLLRGTILIALHRAPEAEHVFSAAVGLCAGRIPPERLWEAKSLLGWSMVKQSRLEEAEPLLLRSFAGLSELLGVDDLLTRAAAARIAEMYEAWRKPDLFAHYQSLATPPTPEEE
jgi:tetratricopeptide (TPR) repeat protein